MLGTCCATKACKEQKNDFCAAQDANTLQKCKAAWSLKQHQHRQTEQASSPLTPCQQGKSKTPCMQCVKAVELAKLMLEAASDCQQAIA